MFEPMEAGAHIICALLHQLLDDETLPEVLASVFHDLLQDSEARFGVPRRKPWSEHLDDKWFFNQAYLRSLARDIGLRFVSALPNTDEIEHLYENSVVSTIKVNGRWQADIPEMVLSKLRAFDASIACEMKRQFSPEAIIKFTK